jgi:hypothetical protein
MSETVNDPGTGTPEGSAGSKVPEGFVSKAELDRALADMHKYKAAARETTEKLKAIETNGLKEKEDWKKLAEIKEEEARVALEESNRLKTSFVNEKKFSAVKEAALKAGVISQAMSDLELLSLDDVQIETTSTGKLNVLGADDFVNRIKTLKPHWFGAVKTTVNSSIPGVTTSGSTTVSKDDIIKLSLEASKSGDYTAYRQALVKFNQQNK